MQHAFVTAAEHGERPVAGYFLDQLVVLEIVLELGAFVFLALDQTGAHLPVLPEVIAQLADQAGVLGEPLHQDGPGAVQRRLGVSHALIGVDIAGGFAVRVQRRVVEQRIGQRFQTGFDGDLALGAALGFVGQVEVFEFGLGVGALDGAGQFIVQLALLVDAGQDGSAPVFQLAQVAQPVFQVAQLAVVQTAGHFLSITTDKRHGSAFIKQCDGRADLAFVNLKFGGDAAFDGRHGRFRCDWIEARIISQSDAHFKAETVR